MDDKAIDAIMSKVLQSEQAYAKAMELIAIFSAGTIGVIVALRPQGHQAPVEIKMAIVTLFVAILGAIIWFMGKGYQYRNLANKILKNPDKVNKASEPWWARIFRVISLITFIFSYYLLFRYL